MQFTAPLQLLVPAPPKGSRRYEDILTVDSASDAIEGAKLGSVTTTTDGDFAGATHTQALRSRIIRMISNPPNAYAHLRDWGLRARKGQLARSSELDLLQLQAQRLLLEDPDVVEATVAISQIDGFPSGFLYEVVVVDRLGNRDSFSTRTEV